MQHVVRLPSAKHVWGDGHLLFWVFVCCWHTRCLLCRSSLEELVLDDEGNLRSNRIENLMREGSKSMAYDPSTLWQLADWILGPKGDGVRKPVVRELVKLLDVAVAGELRFRLPQGCSTLTRQEVSWSGCQCVSWPTGILGLRQTGDGMRKPVVRELVKLLGVAVAGGDFPHEQFSESWGLDSAGPKIGQLLGSAAGRFWGPWGRGFAVCGQRAGQAAGRGCHRCSPSLTRYQLTEGNMT